MRKRNSEYSFIQVQIRGQNVLKKTVTTFRNADNFYYRPFKIIHIQK